MKYSKQFLMELSKKTNFIRDNLEKVLRLSEVLKFLNTDAVFKGKLALKGGTAINLTVVEIPRLSVDIDLDYTDNVSKYEILEIKSVFKKRITDYMIQEDYFLNEGSKENHALLSLVFSYINSAGNKDNIKIEINFMNRCHVLPFEIKSILTKGIIEPFKILTLNSVELYASKINALLSRATPRDLYDVNTMIEQNIIEDKELLKKCLIFYNMIGGEQDINNINYDNIFRINFKMIRAQLKPVISKNDKFNLEAAKENVTNFLKDLIVLTQEEKDFISNFKANIFMPNLLFNTHEQVFNCLLHPMALWRCKGEINLSMVPIHFKKTPQMINDRYKILLDLLVDKLNMNDMQKIVAKIQTYKINEKNKNEQQEYVYRLIYKILFLKKELYNLQILNDEIKENIFRLDMMIIKLENGIMLTNDEIKKVKNIKNKYWK